MASKLDCLLKEYLNDPEVFYDLFNYVFRKYNINIKIKDLEERDSNEISIIQTNNQISGFQRNRDLIKIAQYTNNDNDSEIHYVLLGIENQSKYDPTMIVRVWFYDVQNYYSQIRNIAKMNKKNKLVTNANGDFLSGFKDTDKIIPVITVVVNFSKHKWDHPTSFYSMIDDQQLTFNNLIQNYIILTVDPNQMDDSEFSTFNTGLGAIFGSVKHQDKDNLDFFNSNLYSNLKENSKTIIEVITKLKIGKECINEEERYNMCVALKNDREIQHKLGFKKGIEKGEKIGIKKGEKIGIKKGEKIGIEKGENSYADLIAKVANKLLELNRENDLIKIFNSKSYVKKLAKEFGIQ